MEQREQMASGIAAIVLAALFPIYWIVILSESMGDFEASIRGNLTTLDFSDLILFIIGVLEVYVYLGLRKNLQDYMGTSAAQLLLMIMCATVIAFHSTLFFDVYLAISPSSGMADTLSVMATVIAIGAIMIYSVIGLVFTILLMTNAKEISPLIKVFSVLLLTCCALQLTVVFSFVVVFLFPAALVVLAVHFLKDRNSVEVV